MRNVTFGKYDAYLEFGLIRTGMTIGSPSIKKITVEVEGADGEKDLTEYYGNVHYSNRVLSFEFETPKRDEEFTELYSRILNALHGKQMKVIPSEEVNYYYFGRVSVNEWKSNKAIGKIVIDVNAEPYKLKNNITVVSKTMNGTTSIPCPNLRKPVVPKITISGAATIVFKTYNINGSLLKEYRYTITSSTYPYTPDLPDILFKEGENILEVTMNGAIIIEYQEGVL